MIDCTLTNAGRAAILSAIAGQQLTFMRFEVGDGALSESDTPAEMTALKNKLFNVSISDFKKNDETATVSGAFTNKNVKTPFYYREIGLYAVVGSLPEKIIKVSTSSLTTFFLTEKGNLYGCGANYYGQQGDGTTDEVLTFTKRGENVKDVACTDNVTFYLTNDGELYGCGYNSHGQQGSGSTDNVLTFTKRADNVAAADCSNDTAFYLNTAGELYGCGRNNYGQQGDDTSGLNVKTFTKRPEDDNPPVLLAYGNAGAAAELICKYTDANDGQETYTEKLIRMTITVGQAEYLTAEISSDIYPTVKYVDDLAATKADVDLSNLDATGQAKFDAKADVDLSNLDATGQAKFDAKANTDASNFTAAGKETVVGWGIPDYKAGVDISGYTSSSNQFTCPRSGIVVFNVGGGNNAPGHGYINNVEVMRENCGIAHWTSIPFQVYRGDTVYGSVQAGYGTSKFYPYRGVK